MPTGAITGYIDVAQLVLYAFWIFFAGLIFYLRRENKREGYPLISDRSDRVKVQGFPPIPEPKTFLLPHGGTRPRPRARTSDDRADRGQAGRRWPGAPLQPTGNPMQDGVGPASYAEREDEPELTLDGLPTDRAAARRHRASSAPRGPRPARHDGRRRRRQGRPAPSRSCGSTAPSRRSAISRSRWPAATGRAGADDPGPGQRRHGARSKVELGPRPPVRRCAGAREPGPGHQARGGPDLRLLRGRPPLRHAAPRSEPLL